MTDARGDATREALILAAIAVFSRDGFHAASTRAIAEAADVPQALIGYHFRGKEGLYLAVFEHIAGQLERRLGPVIAAIEENLAKPAKVTAKGSPGDRHLGLLLGMLDKMVALLVRDESAQWAQLIAHEQREPTEAFEILYGGILGRVTGLLTRLVLSVRGGGTQADARLAMISIMGQVLMFRVGRAAVLRQLGWSTIGDKELAIIQTHLRKSITAQLSSPNRRVGRRKGKR
jgi:TetR/AcrR family transcriptional regulator, regulator of cefoperazone and chloramphenicol sensitivity